MSSPERIPAELESQVLAVRDGIPFTEAERYAVAWRPTVSNRPPAASTITAVLKRNGLLAPERRLKRDWQRFEEDVANALWQMDFKGHFPLNKGRCHPLTILDDHSRFCI